MREFIWTAGKTGSDRAFAIRQEVFVKEQGFSNEFDKLDEVSLHLTVYDDNRPAGTLRLLPIENGVAHIGRVAVRREMRGQKLGSALMREGMKKAAELGARRIELGAQKQAAPFYESLGFKICGEPFDDEGCPHLPMGIDLPSSEIPRPCQKEP